jgi:hypothetical protein
LASKVKSRLNHYQILGVSPTAAGDEIARAFAREGSVYRPHAFGSLAELCVAYETLRDPIKRRAYDASLGLRREQKQPYLSTGTRTVSTAQIALAAAPVARHVVARALPPAPPPIARQRPEPHAKPALPLGPGADSHARPDPRIGRGDATRPALDLELGAEIRPIDWKRTGITLGSVVFAACALGGLAGWWSADGVGEAAQPENKVSVELQPAKPLARVVPKETAAAPVAASNEPRARIDPPRPAIAAKTRVERPPIEAEPAVVETPLTGDEPDPSLAEQSVEEAPTASTAAEAAAAAAAMPLSDRVIARTIQRIGYSCGRVASTVPVEGEAPGVFKVTCSSGQSYQAKPVNGRYHFRRWGRR